MVPPWFRRGSAVVPPWFRHGSAMVASKKTKVRHDIRCEPYRFVCGSTQSPVYQCIPSYYLSTTKGQDSILYKLKNNVCNTIFARKHRYYGELKVGSINSPIEQKDNNDGQYKSFQCF